MRRFFQSLFITFILGASLSCGGESAVAQSPSSIKLRCPNPYGSIYGQVFVTSSGNINYTPCPTDSSIFFGGVDFSNATVTGLPFIASPLTTKGDLWGFSTLNARVPVGANGTVLAANSLAPLGVNYQTLAGLGGVTGTGTTNFVPRWTNGAGGVVGNTPFSWDATTYEWNNTALNATWKMSFVPSSTVGMFSIGVNGTGTFLNINQATNEINFGATDTTIGGSLVKIGDAFNVSNAQLITINASAQTIDVNSRGGIFTAGDVSGNSNLSTIQIDDANSRITNTASVLIDNNSKGGIFQAGDTAGGFNNTKITVNDSTSQITLGQSASGLTSDGTTDITIIGDFLGAGNGTKITVDDANATFNFINSGSVGIFDIDNILNYLLFRTITAGGTTGNQTINKPAGTVNFAGGAAALTVTNNTVTTSSIIQITARTNDATCYVKNYVPAAGSFVINMVAACTAETSVGFIVTN